MEEKLSKIDSVVIWDPEELDLIHKTRAVDFVIQREKFHEANFDEIQGKTNNIFWSVKYGPEHMIWSIISIIDMEFPYFKYFALI